MMNSKTGDLELSIATARSRHPLFLSMEQEADAGREEGSKDRPCTVVMTVVNEKEEQVVLVLPITHNSPSRPEDAIEVPAETKRRLRLDSDRSWIVITETNEFVWPGPDLRPIPGRDETTILYGALPPRFFGYVRDKFLERYRHERALRVIRTE